MESHMVSMDNVERDFKDVFSFSFSRKLLKVGMTNFAVEIWVYTKDLCPHYDFEL